MRSSFQCQSAHSNCFPGFEKQPGFRIRTGTGESCSQWGAIGMGTHKLVACRRNTGARCSRAFGQALVTRIQRLFDRRGWCRLWPPEETRAKDAIVLRGNGTESVVLVPLHERGLEVSQLVDQILRRSVRPDASRQSLRRLAADLCPEVVVETVASARVGVGLSLRCTNELLHGGGAYGHLLRVEDGLRDKIFTRERVVGRCRRVKKGYAVQCGSFCMMGAKKLPRQQVDPSRAIGVYGKYNKKVGVGEIPRRCNFSGHSRGISGIAEASHVEDVCEPPIRGIKPSVIRPRAYELRRIFVTPRPKPYVSAGEESSNGTGPVRTVRYGVFYGDVEVGEASRMRGTAVSGDKGEPALSRHLGQVNFAADLAYPYFTRKRPVTGTRLRLNPYRHRNVRVRTKFTDGTGT
ncbi:hypothetical protein DFH09DRAFT_1076801 [Mycena vulgaris]|nr:hypothetical protein DFH09DRAFT_1076801 [Mycena vulgaris]